MIAECGISGVWREKKLVDIILGLEVVSLKVIEMISPYADTLFHSQITY